MIRYLLKLLGGERRAQTKDSAISAHWEGSEASSAPWPQINGSKKERTV